MADESEIDFFYEISASNLRMKRCVFSICVDFRIGAAVEVDDWY